MAPRPPSNKTKSSTPANISTQIVRPDPTSTKRPPVPVSKPVKKAALTPSTSTTTSKPSAKPTPKPVTPPQSDSEDELQDEFDEDMMFEEDFEDLEQMEDFDGTMEEDEDDDDDEKYDLDELLDLDSSAKMNKMKRQADGTYKEGEESEESDVENVDVAIDFFDPNPERDYHAVRSFLKNYTDDAELNINEFADLIAGQIEVGTVVKADDAGAEPLGFITALDMHEHKEKECMKQVVDFILSNMGNPKNRAVMEDLLKNAQKTPVGLLIQDRVKNLPLEVVPVLYNELSKDISWANKEYKGKKYGFENYIILAKCCEVAGNISAGPEKKKKKKDAKADVWFTQFEDQFFQENASFVRKFPGNTLVSWPGIGRLPSSYIVMVVPKAGLKKVVDHLNTTLSVNGQSLCE